jgi:outer membrane lipoprotein-sorting protein
MKKTPLLFSATLLFALTAWSGPEVDRLLSEYQNIETVSCRLRRTVDGPIGKIRFISRIYYTNQDQLHVDNLSPLKRRTIADGTRLFQYAEGDPKGFSRPISDLSDEMKISLRKIPGSPMDHLLRLKPFAENELSTENGNKRIGIDAEKTYAVLTLDPQNRLIKLTYFSASDRTKETARYTYSDFREVAKNTQIPFTHQTEISQPGETIIELLQIDSFTANQPVAASLFIPGNFFRKNIDFVDEFSKIFPN